MKYIKKAAFIVLALLLLCGCAEGARQNEKAVETAFWEEGGNTALTCCGSFYADGEHWNNGKGHVSTWGKAEVSWQGEGIPEKTGLSYVMRIYVRSVKPEAMASFKPWDLADSVFTKAYEESGGFEQAEGNLEINILEYVLTGLESDGGIIEKAELQITAYAYIGGRRYESQALCVTDF